MQIPGMPIPVISGPVLPGSALSGQTVQGAAEIASGAELSQIEKLYVVPVAREAIRVEADPTEDGFADFYLQDSGLQQGSVSLPLDPLVSAWPPIAPILPRLHQAVDPSGPANESYDLPQLPAPSSGQPPETEFFDSVHFTSGLPIKPATTQTLFDHSKEAPSTRAALDGENLGLPATTSGMAGAVGRELATGESAADGRQILKSSAEGYDSFRAAEPGGKPWAPEEAGLQAGRATLTASDSALGSEVIAPESAPSAERLVLEPEAKELDGLKPFRGSGMAEAKQVMDAPLLVHADWTKGSPAKALPGASDSVRRISVGAPEGRMPIPLVPIQAPLISAQSINPSGPVADPLIPLVSRDGNVSIKASVVRNEPAARPSLHPEALFLRYELEEALRSGAPPSLSKGHNGIEVRKVAAPESTPLTTDVDQSGLVATLPVLGLAEMTAVASDPGIAALADLHPGPGPAIPAEIGKAAGPILAQITSQLIERFAQGPNGSTTVTLSPEELGQVRISFQPDAQNLDRIVVMLSFDRPETMDLFRRNADQLAEALRTAGYSGVQMGFGDLGGEGFRQRSSEILVPDPSPLASDPLNETATPASAPRPTGLGALDLRL